MDLLLIHFLDGDAFVPHRSGSSRRAEGQIIRINRRMINFYYREQFHK